MRVQCRCHLTEQLAVRDCDTLGIFGIAAQGSADIIEAEFVGTFCLFVLRAVRHYLNFGRILANVFYKIFKLLTVRARTLCCIERNNAALRCQQGSDLFQRRGYVNFGVRIFGFNYADYGHIDLCRYLVYVLNIVRSYTSRAAEYSCTRKMSHHVQPVERLALDCLA